MAAIMKPDTRAKKLKKLNQRRESLQKKRAAADRYLQEHQIREVNIRESLVNERQRASELKREYRDLLADVKKMRHKMQALAPPPETQGRGGKEQGKGKKGKKDQKAKKKNATLIEFNSLHAEVEIQHENLNKFQSVYVASKARVVELEDTLKALSANVSEASSSLESASTELHKLNEITAKLNGERKIQFPVHGKLKLGKKKQDYKFKNPRFNFGSGTGADKDELYSLDVFDRERQHHKKQEQRSKMAHCYTKKQNMSKRPDPKAMTMVERLEDAQRRAETFEKKAQQAQQARGMARVKHAEDRLHRLRAKGVYNGGV
jgi:hypothetical protein